MIITVALKTHPFRSMISMRLAYLALPSQRLWMLGQEGDGDSLPKEPWAGGLGMPVVEWCRMIVELCGTHPETVFSFAMHTMALSRSCSLALVTAFWLDDGTKRDHNDGRGQRWRMWIREESSLTILEAGDKVVWASLTRAISTIAPAQLSGRCAEQATTLLEDQQVKLHSWLMLTTWHGVNTYQHQHMFDILWHSLTIFFELVILLVGPSGLSLGDTSFYYLLPKQWSSNTMVLLHSMKPGNPVSRSQAIVSLR